MTDDKDLPERNVQSEMGRRSGKSWAATKANLDELNSLHLKWHNVGLDSLAFSIAIGAMNAERLAREIHPSYTAAIFDPPDAIDDCETADMIEDSQNAFRGVDSAYLIAFCIGALEFWDSIRLTE